MITAGFTTDPPFRVGSRYDQVAKFLGKTIESSFEVIEHEPGRMVKATSTAGSFPITFTRTVEPADGGSRVSALIEGDASGFFRLAAPIMRWMVRRSVNRDYAKLKRLLEEATSTS